MSDIKFLRYSDTADINKSQPDIGGIKIYFYCCPLNIFFDEKKQAESQKSTFTPKWIFPVLKEMGLLNCLPKA